MILVLCELFKLDYLQKKQTKYYSESHKELASLLTFPAMRESKSAKQKNKSKCFLQKPHFFLLAFYQNNTYDTITSLYCIITTYGR